MRIALMGYGKWACATLRILQEAGHTITCVVCAPVEYETKRQEYYEKLFQNGLYESLIDVAQTAGLEILRVEDTESDNFCDKMRQLEVTLIVSCGWHRILGRRLLGAFVCINIHGSLLPNYRGRMPVAWAILNGETQTGVSVHFMTTAVDQGGIICQESFPISATDTVADVLRHGMGLYPKLLLKAVMLISTNSATPIEQNACAGSYWPQLTDIDAKINWKQPSRKIFNLIRAQCSPYPGAYAFLNNKKVVINKASFPVDHRWVSPISGIVFGKLSDGSLMITTGDGYLLLDEIVIGIRVSTSCVRVGSRLS